MDNSSGADEIGGHSLEHNPPQYLNNPPWGLRWRSNTFFIIFTVGMGIFTDLFLYSLIVPVMPFVLADRLHVPKAQIQRYVSGLLAAFAGASFLFSPIAGWLADRISGRRKPFLAGLVSMLLSTVLLALGNSVAVLMIARMLQGMSSAVVWTIGLAICVETVGPSMLGTTIGSIFSVIFIGTQAAPVVGGLLYNKTGYIGVFGVGISIIFIDSVLRLLVIEKKTAAAYHDEAKDDHESEAPLVSTSETSPLLDSPQKQDLSAYVLLGTRTKLVQMAPILACMRDASLLTALLMGFTQSTLLGAFDATIPTVALEYYGFDSLQSGLLFLADGLPSLLLGPLAGYCVDRFGTKPSSVLGYAYLTPCLILLRIPQPGGSSEVKKYAAILAFCGVGLAAIDAPSLVETSLVVEKYHKANPEFFGENGPYAQLYGLNSMIFSAGFTLGPLIAGLLKERIGYGDMNFVLAGLCAVTAMLAFLYIGGRPPLNPQRG